MFFRTFAAVLLFLGTAATLNAQQYSVTGRIPLSGDEGWDYLIADPSNRQLYVSHGTNVQVVDLDTGKQVCQDRRYEAHPWHRLGRRPQQGLHH